MKSYIHVLLQWIRPSYASKVLRLINSLHTRRESKRFLMITKQLLSRCHVRNWGTFTTTGLNFTSLLAQSTNAPVGVVQFHQQNYAQLHHCAQVENTLSFYAECPTPYASKIYVNQLAKGLRVKCWWNWHQFFTLIQREKNIIHIYKVNKIVECVAYIAHILHMLVE